MAAYTIDVIRALDLRTDDYLQDERIAEGEAYANAAWARWYWRPSGQIREQYERDFIHSELIERHANGEPVGAWTCSREQPCRERTCVNCMD